MESEQNLLESIVIETVIPQNGVEELSDLFRNVSLNDPDQNIGIVDIRSRDLLFVGTKTDHRKFIRNPTHKKNRRACKSRLLTANLAI